MMRRWRCPVGHGRRRGAAAGVAAALAAGAWAVAAPAAAVAQTDFYNLDKDRPLRVEDAFATKRYAFEVQVSPLTLAQFRDGTLRYAPSAELKHGLLPGFEVSAGLGAAVDRNGDRTRASLHELELSGLLNLTVETPRLPALATRVTGHIAIDGEDRGSTLEWRGIATRGLFGPVRAHLNGARVFGDPSHERWWAGLALDYVLPFRHTLLLAETYVSGREEGRRLVHSAAGFRRQLSPTLALDAGVGRSWTGPAGRDWAITVGLTHEFGVRALMPVARRRVPGPAAGAALGGR